MSFINKLDFTACLGCKYPFIAHSLTLLLFIAFSKLYIISSKLVHCIYIFFMMAPPPHTAGLLKLTHPESIWIWETTDVKTMCYVFLTDYSQVCGRTQLEINARRWSGPWLLLLFFFSLGENVFSLQPNSFSWNQVKGFQKKLSKEDETELFIAGAKAKSLKFLSKQTWVSRNSFAETDAKP